MSRFWHLILSLWLVSCPAVGREQSLAPVVGYAPTYGAFLGAGYFWKVNDTKGGIFGVWTSEGAREGGLRLSRDAVDHEVRGALTYKRGFEPFFGWDRQNSPGELRLKAFRLDAHYQGLWPVTRAFRMGFQVGSATRTGDPVPETGRGRTDTSFHLGAVARLDDWLVVRLEHHWMLNQKNILRGIVDLSPTWDFKNFQLALHGLLGWTGGEYSPVTGFSLGGSDFLRGYRTQRFQGRYAYLAEGAVRLTTFFPFVFAVFGGAGEAFLNVATGPKPAGGVGVHYAIPPDGTQIVRLDFGVGQDQYGVYLDFGAPF